MTGGILSGHEIGRAIQRGEISISPYDPARLNPASYDLTLGDRIAVYKDVTIDVNGYNHLPDGYNIHPSEHGWIDAAKENKTVEYVMEQDKPFYLRPGVGYLMHTVERIKTTDYVPIIDGKSSIGRLFASIHITAGYGDPGFDGQYTLEVMVVHPLLVYPGMRFCQMRFHTIIGSIQSYQENGNYTGPLAEGPVPSRSWQMFKK